MAEISRLEGVLATCNGSLSTCNANAIVAAGDIAELNAEIAAVEATLATTQANYSACGVQVAALGVTNGQLLTQAVALNATIADLQATTLPNVQRVAFAQAFAALASTPEFAAMNDAYFTAYPEAP